jgi:ATP-grasp ribosomal peptide maturase
VTVLVLAQEPDLPTDEIVLGLAERGVPVFRADLSWFPQRLELAAILEDGYLWCGRLSTATRSVELAEIRSVWYRHPSAFAFPSGMSEVEQAHAYTEARLGVGGVLAALPVRWVNNPNRAADAMYKPVQLATAAACGLRVPPTLVTNRPGAVVEFVAAAPDGVVCKTFGANGVTENGTRKVAYTHRLGADDLNDLRGVVVTAHQIQHWVEKDHEVRVVMVGDRMFGITIRAHNSAARIDWRRDFDALSYERIQVPEDVDKGIRSYMGSLGLSYAALDFCVDRDGGWLFLESNSAGQYSWLEAATDAPITEALIDLLADGEA